MKKRITCRIGIAALLFVFAPAAMLGAQTIDGFSFDWKKIESNNFEVIFPSGYEAQGAYVSSCLEYLFPVQLESLDPKRTFRFPVLMNPDRTDSNGFVSSMPRRSFFYPAPSSDNPGGWFSLLAVHEGRHMFQLGSMNRNTLYVLELLAGQTMFPWFAPFWWFEGDAVLSETLYTQTGRGRDPSFTAQFKALMLDGAKLNFDQAYLGSKNRNLPNHYVLGYLMQTWMRTRKNADAHAGLFSRYSLFPFPAFGGNYAMRKTVGAGEEKTYQAMAAEYSEFWKTQAASLSITPAEVLGSRPDSFYTEYRFLTPMRDGKLAASRVDGMERAQLVLIDGRTETPLIDAFPYNSFDSGAKLLVWDELVSDAKFDRSRFRIMLYDTESRKKKVLADDSLFSYPAIKSDDSVAAAVEQSKDGSSSIVLLSTADGSEIRRYSIGAGEAASDLSFSPDGKKLLYVSNGVFYPAEAQGKRICSLDLESGIATVLLDAGWENVKQPAASGDAVFYVSSWSGIESIYALLPDGTRHQVVSRPIGVGYPVPSASADVLYFIDHADSRGKTVCAAPLRREEWVPFEAVKLVREDFFAPLSSSEPFFGRFDPEAAFSFAGEVETEDYSLLLQGNRIDSWGLQPAGAGNPSLSNGVEGYVHAGHIAGLQEQTAAIGYDFVNRSVGYSWGYAFKGFRPDLSVRAGQLWRNAGSSAARPDSFGIASISLLAGRGITGGATWSTLFSVGAGALQGSSGTEFPLQAQFSAGIATYPASVSFVAIEECNMEDFSSAAKEIAEFLHTGFHRSATVSASVRLPVRSVLGVSASYERRDASDSARIAFSKGFYSLAGAEIVKGTADLKIPVLYPDQRIGALAYFNSVYVDLFYNYTHAFDSSANQSSFGAELLFNYKVLRLSGEIDSGIRASWLIEKNRPQWELLFLGVPLPL